MYIHIYIYVYTHTHTYIRGFPCGAKGKEPACQFRTLKRCGMNPWVQKIPWRRAWQPAPVFWRIPWTEETGRLQSMWLQRVGHNGSD